MNLPSDTPRPPKWIFLLGDLFLLLAAWAIYNQAAKPLTGVALLAIAICAVAALVVGVIPFVADYARKQDEALDNRQRSLQALSVTVAASAEQIAIAATGLQGLSEAAQENLAKSEAVAKQTNERVAELQALLNSYKKEGSEAAQRLDAAVKSVQSAASAVEAAAAKAAHDGQAKADSGAKQILEKVSELRAALSEAKREDADASSRLEGVIKRLTAAATRVEEASHPAPAAHPAATELAPVPADRIVEIKPAVASSVSPFEVPEPKAEASPAPAPEARVEPEPAPPVPAASEVAAESPAPAAPAPAPRKRSPRKSAPAPTPPVEAAPAEPAAGGLSAPEPVSEPAPVAVAAAELVLEPAAPEPSAAAPEISEPAVSADGATRLVVTAYIGIGNRLFIRGEGPGLSWDKGVPLSFVSIGKWRWETNDATSAVRFKLYKNDEIECAALGQRSVEPGAQQELSAAF